MVDDVGGAHAVVRHARVEAILAVIGVEGSGARPDRVAVHPIGRRRGNHVCRPCRVDEGVQLLLGGIRGNARRYRLLRLTTDTGEVVHTRRCRFGHKVGIAVDARGIDRHRERTGRCRVIGGRRERPGAIGSRSGRPASMIRVRTTQRHRGACERGVVLAHGIARIDHAVLVRINGDCAEG